jgi:hypothetical protein
LLIIHPGWAIRIKNVIHDADGVIHPLNAICAGDLLVLLQSPLDLSANVFDGHRLPSSQNSLSVKSAVASKVSTTEIARSAFSWASLSRQVYPTTQGMPAGADAV